MYVLEFWTELQNPEVSITFLKSDSTTDDLKSSLKFSKQTIKKFTVESVFELL